ncbi:hypothetical protein [Halorarius litoreus]|jgi:hypothetical protein|uniref:hypothetical protein n=1 Tax=Halorarius litoreus TaxID=2962676 RepID=UPI0020CE9D25|nr:hypothetical protein [Halorarius litoreus]
MTNQSSITGLQAAVARTRAATSLTLRRREPRAVFIGVTSGYLLVYLWVIGHLAPGLGGYGVTVVADPLAKLLRPELGPFMFTSVARVQLGPLTYLASFNTVVGLGISVLVGLNLALTYLAWTQPKACGIGESSSGLLAGLPALLSGTACCGPVLLLVVGIQASGVLITAFQFLLPVAALVLVGSLILVGRQITPSSVSHPPR